ncbi:S-adenosylmethionine decarboxylase [Amanita muscaria]
MSSDFYAPFEGPEKLLELWFAPSARALNHQGLRTVDRKLWEEVLDIVKCKILSVIHGSDMDAYLLSESSLFISPHRLILKTCGTTLNLLGLPRILEIAATYANLPNVYRCFYSRKSFMFPERQCGPHRDWNQEVQFLDNLFDNGAAYTVGKVNGDHWLLYLMMSVDQSPDVSLEIPPTPHQDNPDSDYTIEILMSDLSPTTRENFFFSEPDNTKSPADWAKAVSDDIGITNIFPPHLTNLDAYAFTPCGYSANALIKWDDCLDNTSLPHNTQERVEEGYYTIHVTPEAGWSYASFECNVPLPVKPPPDPDPDKKSSFVVDLETLVERVVSIFRPARLTVTLFISRLDSDGTSETWEDASGLSAVEAAQRAFRSALTSKSAAAPLGGRTYRRTDKINYEFGGYDLAFASFELRS